MSETQLFRLGADVRCADGECGELKSLVVRPGDDVVTHLVVEQKHGQVLGKLVPLGLVGTEPSASASDQIWLRCTMAEYGQLDPAEATYFYPSNEKYQIRPENSGASWPYYAPPGAMGGPGLPSEPGNPQEFTVDTVPEKLPGEDEVFRGKHVHAKDGDIGHVQGIAVDPATGRVTFVLLRTGRLWSHRAVLVPRSAVTEIGADGFHLDVTVQQVRNLPPADIDHPAG